MSNFQLGYVRPEQNQDRYPDHYGDDGPVLTATDADQTQTSGNDESIGTEPDSKGTSQDPTGDDPKPANPSKAGGNTLMWLGIAVAAGAVGYYIYNQ